MNITIALMLGSILFSLIASGCSHSAAVPLLERKRNAWMLLMAKAIVYAILSVAAAIMTQKG